MTDALLDAFRAHADRTSAFIATLEGFETWADADGACVRYVDVSGHFLGATEPFAPVDRRAEVALSFGRAARAAGRRAALLPVTESLARALEAQGWQTQAVGREPVFDFAELYDKGVDPLSLRPRLRGLVKKGLSVEWLTGEQLLAEPDSLRALEAVHAQWQKRLRSPPLSFLSRSAPFERAAERRYGLVRQDGALVAFVSAVPAPAARAWYFADLCRTADARPGALELALFEGMRALHAEGAREARLGLAALAEVDLTILAGPSGVLLRGAARFSRRLYDFQGNAEFKRRLQPSRWETLFVVSDGPIDLRLWRAVLQAHLPSGLVHALSVALVQRPLTRFLRDDLRLEPWPTSTADLMRRTRLTTLVVALCLGLHLARILLPPVDALFRASAFTPGAPTALGLLVGPLFHNHAYHLFGDLLSFVVFGGLLELLAGRAFFLWSLAAGLWLSNPVTWALVGGPMQTLWPEGYANFLREVDYGSSNAIYAFVGGLATCLRQPLLLLVPFFANAVWVCLANESWLALHHHIALFAGWAAFRVLFVPRRRRAV